MISNFQKRYALDGWCLRVHGPVENSARHNASIRIWCRKNLRGRWTYQIN